MDPKDKIKSKRNVESRLKNEASVDETQKTRKDKNIPDPKAKPTPPRRPVSGLKTKEIKIEKVSAESEAKSGKAKTVETELTPNKTLTRGQCYKTFLRS